MGVRELWRLHGRKGLKELRAELLALRAGQPFDRPSSGRIAVKVINHLGDEVMKVFRV